MNITVFLGSSFGNDPAFREAAKETGRIIAESGNVLVYGGAKVGTMGDLAQSALDHNGKVIGVMPEFMTKNGRHHEHLTELHVVPDMSERKKIMIRLGHVFIALPGGPGTLEEITQVISLKRLGIKQCTCMCLNINHYYDDLKAMFQKMNDEGFAEPGFIDTILFPESTEELEEMLKILGSVQEKNRE